MVFGKILTIITAATLIAGAGQAEERKSVLGSKTSFFTADNGLGAAAIGEVGLTLGAMAFSGPSQWQGFEQGSGGPQISGIADVSGDCASANVGNLARALIGAPPPPPPPEGVIRTEKMGDRSTGEDTKPFDMKAIYQPGQAFSCPLPSE